MKIHKVWIDLDNSPHVPLFIPIIRELEKRGIKTFITARDFAQTIPLLKLWNVDFVMVGKHGGKNKYKKIRNLLHRTVQLIVTIRKKNIDLAISHGSRTQVIAARILDIPSILMLDYEYTEHWIFNNFSTFLLMPKHIPDSRLKLAKFNLKKVIRYNGFKEELYLPDFIADMDFRSKLSIDEDKILIVQRSGVFADQEITKEFLKSVFASYIIIVFKHRKQKAFAKSSRP